MGPQLHSELLWLLNCADSCLVYVTGKQYTSHFIVYMPRNDTLDHGTLSSMSNGRRKIDGDDDM